MSMPFQTRKSIDFMYWCLVLYFHKYGHFYLPEGRALTLLISQYINTSRYSTNLNTVTIPNLDMIKLVLSLEIPVTLTPNMSHLTLSQALAKINLNRHIWVYDHGVVVSGSPFLTQSSALIALGLNPKSSAIRRTIDTGKQYLNRYTFYSISQ
jgi:hypothetical protein